jgi:hypothetical protein
VGLGTLGSDALPEFVWEFGAALFGGILPLGEGGVVIGQSLFRLWAHCR